MTQKTMMLWVSHLELDFLKCEVKWALRSITRNKASGGDGIPVAAAAKSLKSCLTVPPHRWQLSRLHRPWDSPGKNTCVGCHFLLQCTKVKSESDVAQSCPTLSDPMYCSLPGSSVHGIFQARVLEWGAIAFSEIEGQCYFKEHSPGGRQTCILTCIWPHQGAK